MEKKLFILLLSFFLVGSVTFAQSYGDKAEESVFVEAYKVVMYPNPVTDGVFKIKSNSLIKSVEVMNVIGQSTFKSEYEQFSPEIITIRLENYKKGLHLVKIVFLDKKTVIKKLLVK